VDVTGFIASVSHKDWRSSLSVHQIFRSFIKRNSQSSSW